MPNIKEQLEEQIWLLKIRHGDQESFAHIYDRYVDALFRYVSFRVPTPETAEDITSELFLKVWQYLTGDNDTKVDNLRAYLYKVARNLIADHYRGSREQVSLDDISEIDILETNEVDINLQLSLGEIEQAVRRLKSPWQEVVILAYVEGFKPQEIAEVIGKSPAATRVILHRALQELKRLLNP